MGNNKLRDALAAIVGSDDVDHLRRMEALIVATAPDSDDKAASLKAIRALIDTAPEAESLAKGGQLTEQQAVPELVCHAIERCLRSQEALADKIDDANPDDAYASLLVREDVEYLRAWLAAVKPAVAPEAESSDEAPRVLVHWPRRAGRTTERLMALRAALHLYPQQNKQLLQANKVCAGVSALAGNLLAERAKEVRHGL